MLQGQVKNRVPGHPEKFGGEVGQKCRILEMFHLLYPQFLWMAWNPISDLFQSFSISGPVARNGERKGSSIYLRFLQVPKAWKARASHF